jgi:hypothetical protein
MGFARQVRKGNVEAGTGEFEGDGPANAFRAAGDECDFRGHRQKYNAKRDYNLAR